MVLSFKLIFKFNVNLKLSLSTFLNECSNVLKLEFEICFGILFQKLPKTKTKFI